MKHDKCKCIRIYVYFRTIDDAIDVSKVTVGWIICHQWECILSQKFDITSGFDYYIHGTVIHSVCIVKNK